LAPQDGLVGGIGLYVIVATIKSIYLNIIFDIAAVVGAFIPFNVVRLFAAAASPASTRSAADGSTVMQQIKKPAELQAAGILTDPEFASKKAELLSRH
jgi:hypothetical protein